MVNEARSIASHVNDQANHHMLAFGPTNVGLHYVAALVNLGEGGLAVEIAAGLDPAGIGMLRRERRATHLIDMARGYSQWGKRDQALEKLLEAERLAPREVNCRPVARNLISNMLDRSRGTAPTSLQLLAERSGVTG
jgi:hypothetical protein